MRGSFILPADSFVFIFIILRGLNVFTLFKLGIKALNFVLYIFKLQFCSVIESINVIGTFLFSELFGRSQKSVEDVSHFVIKLNAQRFLNVLVDFDEPLFDSLESAGKFRSRSSSFTKISLASLCEILMSCPPSVTDIAVKVFTRDTSILEDNVNVMQEQVASVW